MSNLIYPIHHRNITQIEQTGNLDARQCHEFQKQRKTTPKRQQVARLLKVIVAGPSGVQLTSNKMNQAFIVQNSAFGGEQPLQPIPDLKSHLSQQTPLMSEKAGCSPTALQGFTPYHFGKGPRIARSGWKSLKISSASFDSHVHELSKEN